MTLKEADAAAQRGQAVRYQGIKYKRIIQTGYNYDNQGRRSGFVLLLDKCGNSVTHANPDRCELIPEDPPISYEQYKEMQEAIT